MMVKQAPADATLKANSHLRLRQDTEVRPSPTEITMLKTANALPKRVRRTRWQPIILLPSAISAAYLYEIASDQFVSEFRFHVRHAPPSAMDTSSPVSGLTGAASVALQGMTDSEIVVQYLQSRKVLDDLRPLVDIEHIYARPDADWFARLGSNEPIENQLLYWRRVVDPFFDLATGIITVKVRAFDPAEAQQVSEALLGLSEKLVNSLSDRAKYNKLNYARQEVEQKVTAMRETELALRDFRNRNAVLFPNIQATESAGVDEKLQDQISTARASLNALRIQGLEAGAPRIRLLENRISGLEAEAAQQQTRVTVGDVANLARPVPLASAMASYDALDVDAKIAAKSYEMAVMAEQRAVDEAAQQQIYLDTFVTPGKPERSLYPERWRVLLQILASTLVIWCLGTLIWRATLDHME